MADIGITQKCNNNCIMCTTTNKSTEWGFAEIIRLIDSVPPNEPTIILNGGEPTLHKELFRVISYLQKKFPKTKIKLITNGRMLCYPDFAEKIRFSGIEVISELHGPTAEVHEGITLAEGSFDQTVAGLRNILSLGVPTELRLVLSRRNYRFTAAICKYILDNLPQTQRIVIFPIDLIGEAHRNLKLVAVRYTELKPYLEQALTYASGTNMDVKVYHTPFCSLDPQYWKFVEGLTVVSSRVTIAKKCGACVMKPKCPRVWRTYLARFGDSEFKPILDAKLNMEGAR